MESYTLKHPVQYGSETVTELALKPCAKAFKGFSQEMAVEGSITYAPYDLARVAVRMSGRPDPFLDLMHPDDMFALSEVALRFLGSGLTTGK
jgi:hypothetical protein